MSGACTPGPASKTTPANEDDVVDDEGELGQNSR